MKLLIDDQIFTLQKYGGISTYHDQLLNNYLNIKIISGVLLSNNPVAQRHLGAKATILPKPLVLGINYLYCLYQIASKKPDLMHQTYHIPFMYPFVKKVLTIHDLAYEKLSSGFSINAFLRRLALRSASQIIVPSKQTKQDLIDCYSVPTKKISVIYHGLTEVNKSYIPKNLPEKYVLYVGLRKSYKNFLPFISAISSKLKQNNMSLVCFGGGDFTKEELHTLSKLNITHLYLPYKEEHRNQVYSHAKCFVYPSLNEGFGIPLLEAMSNKAPLLISNLPCFKEVAKDAAIYFDPKHAKSMQSALETLLNDSKLRQDIILRGLKRVKDFSWSKASIKTEKVYQRTLQ